MIESLMLVNSKRKIYLSSGPGPSELIGGDEDAGFFGEVPADDFITGDQLASVLMLTEGTSQNSTTPWLKFVLDGRILFIPKKTIRHSLTWHTLYYNGCVFGNEIDNKPPLTFVVEQNRTINVKGYYFRVRLMKGSLLDPYAGVLDTTDNESPETIGSEWNRLMYSVSVAPTPSLTNEKWASYTLAELGISSGTGQSTLCQETIENYNTQRLVRGYYGIQNSNYTEYNNSSTILGWRPVLELLQDDINAPINLSGYIISNELFSNEPFTEENLFLAPHELNSVYIPDQQTVIN